jgi:dehydrogenase/reductase SDR family protein 12
LRDSVEEIRNLGADLWIVGNGSAEFARTFREDLGIDATILVDAELRSYRAAGLRRGRVEILSPRMPLHAIRAFRDGHRQTGVQGDAWQLGGAFIIATDGRLLFHHESREAGDHPTPSEILSALRRNRQVEEQLPAEPSALQRTIGELAGSLLDPTIVFSFDRSGFLARSLAFSPGDLDVDMSDRRSVITGGNSGIGYETALALADLGSEVILLCRNLERGQSAAESIRTRTGNGRVTVVQADLSDLASIREAVRSIPDGPIDRLIHNAGVLPDREHRTSDGLEETFATHVVGPHLLTRLLMPRLERSDDARVLWVTSGGMYTNALDVDAMVEPPAPYDGVRAYARSKRAQVVLAELWAEELRGRAVVHSMHPGWADTPAVRSSLPSFHRIMRPLLRTPAEGADTLVWLAASESARQSTGSLFFDRKARRTHYLPGTGESEEERRLLWETCEGFSIPRGESANSGGAA